MPTDIATLAAELAGIELFSDDARTERYARDFSWFSPILSEQLAGRRADLVARPVDEAQLARVMAACHRAGVPVTPRGRGTGNYGQCTPLQGGVVLDFARMDQVLWVRDGVARAQAGALLSDIDRAAWTHGRELRMLPSTYRMSSAAGFFCGGFGGVGSIQWGTIGDPGNVTAVRVMTLEAAPRTFELTDAEARDLYHAYGINGVITEIAYALAPREDWRELAIAQPDLGTAMRLAKTIGDCAGIATRMIGVMDDPVPRLCGIGELAPSGQALVLATVARSSEEATRAMAADHGGQVALAQDYAEVYGTRHTLIERCWNHTTLHAKAQDQTLTYIECVYAPHDYVDRVVEMRDRFAGELLQHVELMRLDGALTAVGIPLVRYRDAERLEAIMQAHRDRGVYINNPHTYVLGDGGKLTSESRSLAMKRRLDPAGLLNPGKVRPVAA